MLPKTRSSTKSVSVSINETFLYYVQRLQKPGTATWLNDSQNFATGVRAWDWNGQWSFLGHDDTLSTAPDALGVALGAIAKCLVTNGPASDPELCYLSIQSPHKVHAAPFASLHCARGVAQFTATRVSSQTDGGVVFENGWWR